MTWRIAGRAAWVGPMRERTQGLHEGMACSMLSSLCSQAMLVAFTARDMAALSRRGGWVVRFGGIVNGPSLVEWRVGSWWECRTAALEEDIDSRHAFAYIYARRKRTWWQMCARRHTIIVGR